MKTNNKKTLKLQDINNIKNKTKKKRKVKSTSKINKSLINLSKQQKDIVCKNFFNKYDTFEDKIEENFKKRDAYSNAINESLNNIRNL